VRRGWLPGVTVEANHGTLSLPQDLNEEAPPCKDIKLHLQPSFQYIGMSSDKTTKLVAAFDLRLANGTLSLLVKTVVPSTLRPGSLGGLEVSL
jgi:hypothetical protein